MENITLTSEEALGVGGIVGGVLGVFIAAYAIIAFVWWLIQVIAKWKIFTKAGEAGWKSIIPFYNEYIQFKFTWSTSIFWIMMVLSIVLGVLKVSMESANQVVSLISAIGTIVAGIAIIVIAIKQYNYLAKSFGKGVGFTIGLIFLTPIFLLILGFGKSEYIGNTSQDTVE